MTDYVSITAELDNLGNPCWIVAQHVGGQVECLDPLYDEMEATEAADELAESLGVEVQG